MPFEILLKEHVFMSANQPLPKLLLTLPEAAEALAMSKRTLWGLTARGEIVCVRIGRLVRYRLEDLNAFVATKVAGFNSTYGIVSV
jgi:excisionase family DNA binding protein